MQQGKNTLHDDGWERIVQIDASDQMYSVVGMTTDIVVFCTTRFPRHTR